MRFFKKVWEAITDAIFGLKYFIQCSNAGEFDSNEAKIDK